jgi:hypothetical protein
LLSGYLRSIKKKAKTIRRVGISVYLPTRLARDDTSLTPWPDTIKLKSLVLTLPFYFLSQTDIANVSFFVVSKRWNYQTIFERERKKGTFQLLLVSLNQSETREMGTIDCYPPDVCTYSYIAYIYIYIYFFLALFFLLPFSFFTSWPSFNRVRARLTSVFLFRPYILPHFCAGLSRFVVSRKLRPSLL